MFSPVLGHLCRMTAAACLALLPMGAHAQANTGQTFGDWTVTCEALGVGRTACMLEQTLTRNPDGAFVAQVLALWSGAGDQRFIALRVPLGVYLASGIELRADGADDAFPLIWQTCTPRFCEALHVIDDADLEAFTAGEGRVLAGYRGAPNAQPTVFSFSMGGVLEGLEALRPAP